MEKKALERESPTYDMVPYTLLLKINDVLCDTEKKIILKSVWTAWMCTFGDPRTTMGRPRLLRGFTHHPPVGILIA